MLNILVTGAAGLIGGEVCARLVKAGHTVFALTHRTPEILGNDGIPVARAEVLKGNICLAGLGIVDAPDIDLVVHCAASLMFDAPYDELEAINVGGTRNVVDFARNQGAALLHVSTAYVCGLRDGAIAEEAVLTGTRFANGYERSKAEAEAVVRASGVRHCIVRPAIVLGDSRTGAIRKFDAMYQTFALIARGLVREIPIAPGASLDFVPIDHVAEGITRLATGMVTGIDGEIEGADGATCHLTSSNPLPVACFAEAIAAYPHFCAPQMVPTADFDPDSLPPVQRRVWRRIASAYASYFQRNPRFGDANLRALTGLSAPDTGPDWFHRLINFAMEGGLLPEASVIAHRDKDRPAAAVLQRPTASLP